MARADAVADEGPHDPVAALVGDRLDGVRRRRRGGCPARAAAIPASIPRRVASISSATSRGTRPDGPGAGAVGVPALPRCSRCRGSTTSPSARRRRGDGMPWTTSSLIDGADEPGNGGFAAVAEERRHGARVADHARSAIVSSSPVRDAGPQLGLAARRGRRRGWRRRARMRGDLLGRLIVTAPTLRIVMPVAVGGAEAR